MLRMGLGLVVSVAIARYLGPENFGLYSFVLSIVGIVAIFSKLGLENLLKRELVTNENMRNELMGTSIVLSTTAGAVIYALMIFTVGQLSENSLLIGIFALIGAQLFLNPFKVFELWFQSQVRSELSVKATSIAVAVFAMLKIVVIFLGGGLVFFGCLFLLEHLLVVFLQGYFYQRHFGRIFDWKVSWNLGANLLSKSWPLIFSGLAVAVYMRIDQVMLCVMVGDEAVGNYAAAARISVVWYFLPQILATSLFPAIMNARASDQSIYLKRLQCFLDLNAALAYGVAIPLSIGSTWIILILFGPEFGAAGSILAIHAWSCIFVFLGVSRGQYLTAEELFKFSLLCTVLGAVTNLSLNYLLIPGMAGVGAAIATLFSQFVSAFLSSFLSSATRSIGVMQFKALFAPLRIRSFFE